MLPMLALAYACRGAAQYGELGYGDGGKKSSANPDKCMTLEGAETLQVLSPWSCIISLILQCNFSRSSFEHAPMQPVLIACMAQSHALY